MSEAAPNTGLNMIMQLAESFMGRPEQAGQAPKQRGIFGRIIDYFTGRKPEVVQQANEVAETAKQERASVFGETVRAMYMRQMPGWATAGFDIAKAFGVVKNGPEVYGLQHEIETFLAVTRLCPDFLKKWMTDPIAKTDIFQTLVKNWPMINGIDIPFIGGNQTLPEKVAAGDPDAVIDAIRIMHQDIVSGVASGQAIMSWFSGK